MPADDDVVSAPCLPRLVPHKLFATAQTTHDTDLVIREFVLPSQPSVRILDQWMKRAPSAVLRVNSAGVLAKLGSTQLNDEVVRTLKGDPDTRQLYLTAVASRTLGVPWAEAAALSANIGQDRDSRTPTDIAKAQHFIDRLVS
jgi:hypothetical protein